MSLFKINDFVDYITRVKNHSSHTVESYKRDIVSFVSYIKSRGIDDVTGVTENDITFYTIKLNKLGKSPATISRNIATIRSYFNFLHNKNLISSNPSFNVTGPKVERKEPQILTEEEIVKLLVQPDLSTGLGFRDRAMMELLYSSGLKVTEIIALNRMDLNLDLGYIVSKNQKKASDRIVKVTKTALGAVMDYISHPEYSSTADVDGPLFLNAAGERLTRQGLWKIIKRHSNDSGINVEVTPHTIRHSFVIHSLKNGSDPKELQEKLGHMHMSSTNYYCEIFGNSYKKNQN
jgi:integrase/recombinase XerD